MKTEGSVRVTALDWLSLVLVIVGALNWGLVGVGEFAGADWNLVAIVFGSVPTVEALVYILVGLAGLYELYFAYELYGARRTRSERRRLTED